MHRGPGAPRSAPRMPMNPAVQTHPKWKYHPTEPACVVETVEEEARLGEDWVDSPNQFPVADADPVGDAEPVGDAAPDDDAKPKRSHHRRPPS